MGKINEMKYKIGVGPKAVCDIMRRLDLGIDGVVSEELVATLKTTTPLSDDLIKKHKEGLRKGLEKDYYVGKITFVQ